MALSDATFLTFLTATCNVRRMTPGAVNSGTGLPAETWANLATGVLCRFVKRRGREPLTERQRVVVREQLCMLPIGTDVLEGDVIVSGGLTYDVILVEDAAGAAHHKEAVVERRAA